MEHDDVGALLRDARERSALSLDLLAQITKIRVPVLHAIETNRIDELPQEIFVRGLLRAYAREVGLDPEEVVRRYFDQFRAIESPIETPPAPIENASDGPDWKLKWQMLRNVAAVIVVSGLVIAYGAWPRATRPGAPAAPPAPLPSRPEIGTTGFAAPVAVAEAGRVLRVELRTTGDCWVSANVDGEQVEHRLMAAGEQRAFDVKEAAVLRIGDPAALNLAIDGAPARALGTAGQAVTMHITPDNYRAFLRR